jgi:hypothetical protein
MFKAFLLDFVPHFYFCFFLYKDQNVSEIVLFPGRENMWSNELLGLYKVRYTRNKTKMN